MQFHHLFSCKGLPYLEQHVHMIPKRNITIQKPFAGNLWGNEDKSTDFFPVINSCKNGVIIGYYPRTSGACIQHSILAHIAYQVHNLIIIMIIYAYTIVCYTPNINLTWAKKPIAIGQSFPSKVWVCAFPGCWPSTAIAWAQSMPRLCR